MVISNLNYPYDLVVRLLYGCGLRLFECMKLRLHNFNLYAGILTVHEGKGKKDSTVFSKAEKEEKMFLLLEDVVRLLTTHLGVKV